MYLSHTMIFFLWCIVVPTLVFGLNNTNITNEEYTKLVIKDATTYTITRIPNKSSSTSVTNGETNSVILHRNKTDQNMEWVPLENQKKSENPINKKRSVKPKYPRAKKNTTKAEKPQIPIKKDLPDMPLPSDLNEILNSIHKMIDFFLENKNDVDISLYFGLFLLDVNLNKVLKNKQHTLPATITFSLRHLLEKNEHLLHYFKKMVDLDTNPEHELGKNLVALLSNEALWMARIQHYDGTHVNDTLSIDYDALQARYSLWGKYLFNVRDYNQALPRPEQSDRCLGFLGKNPVSKTPWKVHCAIPTGCRIPLEKGTNYGYGLTHRLLYLQLAYYGHRCYVFSNNKDKEMRENFCKSLYHEASYISMNEYEEIDLFVEQLCLCALDGHYEFLRRSWIMGILSFQTLMGCFSDKMPNGAPPPQQSTLDMWRLDRGQNQHILNSQCNIHISSAAAATLGFGVKFIAEAFY